MDEEAVAELGLEPCGFRRHDGVVIRDVHQLFEAGRIHGEGDFGFAGEDNTTDNILFIQSVDDPMVPYETSLKIAEDANNPHIKTIKMNGRKHNPNYTEAAVQYMNQVFGAFNRRVMDKKIASDDERIAYFKDVSIERLTEKDQKLFDKIFDFIN